MVKRWIKSQQRHALNYGGSITQSTINQPGQPACGVYLTIEASG